MRPLLCECGATFESPRAAADRVSGLYFMHRLEVEEHFHTAGICTHEPQRLDGGAVTVCIAGNPVARKVPA